MGIIWKKINCTCAPKCDLFSFMATEMGVSVLHPAGYSATQQIGNYLQLNEKSKVLDVACGVGTTSNYLYKKYKSLITGIDIDENFIEIANKNNNNTKINYLVADTLHLPFPDNSFDAVIAQAFLILIDDHSKALKEIFRVLKPSGYFGSLELSWNKIPNDTVYKDLLRKTCTSFIPRIKEYQAWQELFQSEKFNCEKIIKNPMISGFIQMVKCEGIPNTLHIMSQMMKNKKNRIRMMEVQNTFNKYSDYLNYGIYLLKKN